MAPQDGPQHKVSKLPRWASRKALGLVAGVASGLVLALLAWRSGGARPEAPSASWVVEGDGGGCRVMSDHRRPLVVDWEAQDRADMEVAMHDGIAVVAYDCHSLRLLYDCMAEGVYDFVPVSKKEEVVRLGEKRDLLANLAGKLAYKLDAELAQGMTLDVATVIIGMRRTAKHHLSLSDLRGSGCAEATHFVEGAYVGAFALGLEQRGRIKAASSIFSGDSDSEKVSRYRDGQHDKCEPLPKDVRDPVPICDSLVRLELEPIDPEQTNRATADPDPLGGASGGWLSERRSKANSADSGATAVLGDNTNLAETHTEFGSVVGRVSDADTNHPLAGISLMLSDCNSKELRLTSDPAGAFKFDRVSSGPAEITIAADGYFVLFESIDVKPHNDANVDLMLRTFPKESNDLPSGYHIGIRQPIPFAINSQVVPPESFGLLGEVADTLIRHPEIRRVEVQAHTDSIGKPAHNLMLSERRAEAVRAWLVEHGVSGDRLVAKGYGESFPIEANINPEARARNRRIEFIVLESGAHAAPNVP